MNIEILCIHDITEEDIEDVKNHLPMRYAKSLKFKFRDDFLRCIGAGVLFRRAFPCVEENEILETEYEKPYIPNHDFFNISHSGDYVVLAQAETEVGVDIEKINDRHLNVAERVFTERELLWMNEDSKERFFILWTQKEAVMKAVGKGLSLAPESFDVMPFQENKSIVIDDMQLYCTTQKYKDCYLSVCWECEGDK